MGDRRSTTSSCGANDRVFLDALGTDSLPDPTTAGDFCRRFDADRIDALMDAINETPARGLAAVSGADRTDGADRWRRDAGPDDGRL